jgi:hypothetical protein
MRAKKKESCCRERKESRLLRGEIDAAIPMPQTSMLETSMLDTSMLETRSER